MSKVAVFSLVVVLVVGTGALAGDDQMQDVGITLTNAVDLLHGHQTGNSQQNLCLDTEQDINNGLINQRLLGNFVQVGNACGDCAIIGIAQTLSAGGSQAQTVGYCVEPKMQAQSLGLLAGQGLGRSGGQGGGDANHVIVLQEDQTAVNSGGIMAGNANVVGMQNSVLNGSAGSTSAVGTTMGVETVQSQSSL